MAVIFCHKNTKGGLGKLGGDFLVYREVAKVRRARRFLGSLVDGDGEYGGSGIYS